MSILYQSNFLRSKSKLPKAREDCLHSSNCIQKALPLLLGYFQAHPIIVITDQLIRKTMNKTDAARRLILWAIELSQFNIEYQPRVAIIAQVLTYFIAEFTYTQDNEEPLKRASKIQTDGLTSKKVEGSGVILILLREKSLSMQLECSSQQRTTKPSMKHF